MKIGEDGVTMAAVIREGDYLVFRNDRHGTAVEYAPDAKAGARVIGAFSARRGRVVYLDEVQASDLVQNYSLTAEDHLLRCLDPAAKAKKRQTLSMRIAETVRTFADGGYGGQGAESVWEGSVADFHRAFLFPALGVPLNSRLRAAIRQAGTQIPGLSVSEVNGEHWITVDWSQASTPDVL